MDAMIHLMLNTDENAIILFSLLVVYCFIVPITEDIMMHRYITFLDINDMTKAGASFCHVINTVRLFLDNVSVSSMNHLCIGAAAIFVNRAETKIVFEIFHCIILAAASMIADAIDCTRKYFIKDSLSFFLFVDFFTSDSILENARVFISNEIHTISQEFDVIQVRLLVINKIALRGRSCIFNFFYVELQFRLF
jgi:hypothetical protein